MLFGNKAVAEKLAFICFGYTSRISNFFLRNGVWCARQIEIYSRFGVINRAWCSFDRGPNDCRRTFSSHTSGCRRCKNTAEESVVKENEGASSDPSIPEVKLTSRILFQLIASEIALQRGQPGAAYQTYLTLAEETGDPRIAERAAQIALASNAPKEFRKAVSEWIKLSPDNPKAQEAFIASGIVSNQLDKVAGTAAAFLAKSKDKGAEIIKLQTQLALMKDKAKALSFFRTVTGKYSKFYQTQLGLARLEALNGNVRPLKSTLRTHSKSLRMKIRS